MKTQTLLISFLACFSLQLGVGCVSDSNEDDDIEFAEPSDAAADPKFDASSIAFTTLDISPPTGDTNSYVKVIKSQRQFERVFGAGETADVDFSKEWIVVFAAGLRNSGGFSANIDAISLANKTLSIAARIESPGTDCRVTRNFTFPTQTVKIAKPSNVTRARYTVKENEYSCAEPEACADGQLVTETVLENVDVKLYCQAEKTHCLTNDSSACPQLSPRSPDFCSDGRIVDGNDGYVASADGKECSLPSVLCITNDISACPQPAQIPPNFCPSGSTLTFENIYLPSTDDKQCELPAPRCIPASCP